MRSRDFGVLFHVKSNIILYEPRYSQSPRIGLELVNARIGLDRQCEPEPVEVTPSTFERRARLLDATGNAGRAMT